MNAGQTLDGHDVLGWGDDPLSNRLFRQAKFSGESAITANLADCLPQPFFWINLYNVNLLLTTVRVKIILTSLRAAIGPVTKTCRNVDQI